MRDQLRFEMQKLQDYFDANIEFNRYFRSGSSHMDDLYFVRGNFNLALNLDSYIYESDPEFCTSHDFKISKLLAHGKLYQYLERQMAKLDSKTVELKLSSLTWTGSKTSLTELIYALFASGVFNHGNADIKTITSHFEQSFNIDLGKMYRTYTELRRRNEPTKFLDDLTSTLLRKMEDDDEKF